MPAQQHSLLWMLHGLDSICPDAPKFILGDFHHCTLTKSLKTYEQYVSCATTIKKLHD